MGFLKKRQWGDQQPGETDVQEVVLYKCQVCGSMVGCWLQCLCSKGWMMWVPISPCRLRLQKEHSDSRLQPTEHLSASTNNILSPYFFWSHRSDSYALGCTAGSNYNRQNKQLVPFRKKPRNGSQSANETNAHLSSFLHLFSHSHFHSFLQHWAPISYGPRASHLTSLCLRLLSVKGIIVSIS